LSSAVKKKVSVNITTYNQAAYIAQTVESALHQTVNFDYEIVVGEDCSTDRTREILVELQKSHPDKIRLLLREKNLGVAGKINFVETLKTCCGEYVALLDGDDYWTDPYKLQKQVDFLDNHPDFSICCHNAAILYENGAKGPERFCPPDQKEICTIEDLFAGNFIFAGSAMFRRGLFTEFPDWFFSLEIGDWPLHVMNARHGKIRYFDEVMAVYRVHEAGHWVSMSPSRQILVSIEFLQYVNEYLGFKYEREIKASQARLFLELAEAFYQLGDFAAGRKALGKSFVSYGFKHRRAWSLMLRLQSPTLYTHLRALRNLIQARPSA
jgi:glycosyltransferase involved in cell wall biosynthesis